MVYGQPLVVLKERDITFVSGTADIRARQAPRIIHRGPRREMERGGKKPVTVE